MMAFAGLEQFGNLPLRRDDRKGVSRWNRRISRQRTSQAEDIEVLADGIHGVLHKGAGRLPLQKLVVVVRVLKFGDFFRQTAMFKADQGQIVAVILDCDFTCALIFETFQKNFVPCGEERNILFSNF